MKKLIRILSLILVLTFVFCGCSNTLTTTSGTTTAPAGENDYVFSDDKNTAAASTAAQTTEKEENKVSASSGSKVKFTMENGGEFIVELYPQYAPETVANFVKLVEEGFYDGLTFHRVVDGFMAQGGDPMGTGMGGSDEEIYGEFADNGFAQNTLSHQRGVISMARSSNPDSASSQFFICYDDASFLDGSYAAFGKVIEGMEVVDSFLEGKRVYGSDGALSKPVDPIVIAKAEVIS